MARALLPTSSTDSYLIAYLASIGFVLQGCQPDGPHTQMPYESCWMIMPTGCSRVLRETSDPTHWFVDPKSYDSTTCTNRMTEFNRNCNRSDATSHWGPKALVKPECAWRGKPCPKCDQKPVGGRSYCPSCQMYVEGKCEGHFEWGDECPKEYVNENCGDVISKGKTQDLCKRTVASASTKEDLCPEWVAMGCETKLEDHCDMDLPWGGFRNTKVKDECWKQCTDAYNYVGTGWCRDSSGRIMSYYNKWSGHTDYTCRAQCDLDVTCVAYIAHSTGGCAILAPRRSDAPIGWNFHSGNGTTEITARIGIGPTCMKKVQPYYTDFLGGACPEGHALTEGECASLHGQAVDGNDVFYHGAGYWGNPESCGCYFDQNGNVYFNTRTEECNHMDRWEMSICKKALIFTGPPTQSPTEEPTVVPTKSTTEA